MGLGFGGLGFISAQISSFTPESQFPHQYFYSRRYVHAPKQDEKYVGFQEVGGPF